MIYSRVQLVSLVVLRIAVGWHFLFEGGVKLLNSNWSSRSYLLDSGGFLKEFFVNIATDPFVLNLSHQANAWVLTLIGLSLMLGIFTRFSSVMGMLLLLFYYLSHPAFPGISYLLPPDGSYFIVNKTLVELFALFVLFAFPTSHIVGLYRLVRKPKPNAL